MFNIIFENDVLAVKKLIEERRYDENDITGTALVIQEQMQSILDTIAQMPESADTTSMQQKYQALGDILTSLGSSLYSDNIALALSFGTKTCNISL